jgi:hypothetical protein
MGGKNPPAGPLLAEVDLEQPPHVAKDVPVRCTSDHSTRLGRADTIIDSKHPRFSWSDLCHALSTVVPYSMFFDDCPRMCQFGIGERKQFYQVFSAKTGQPEGRNNKLLDYRGQRQQVISCIRLSLQQISHLLAHRIDGAHHIGDIKLLHSPQSPGNVITFLDTSIPGS